jgi:hypothetical protein
VSGHSTPQLRYGTTPTSKDKISSDWAEVASRRYADSYIFGILPNSGCQYWEARMLLVVLVILLKQFRSQKRRADFDRLARLLGCFFRQHRQQPSAGLGNTARSTLKISLDEVDAGRCRPCRRYRGVFGRRTDLDHSCTHAAFSGKTDVNAQRTQERLRPAQPTGERSGCFRPISASSIRCGFFDFEAGTKNAGRGPPHRGARPEFAAARTRILSRASSPDGAELR